MATRLAEMEEELRSARPEVEGRARATTPESRGSTRRKQTALERRSARRRRRWSANKATEGLRSLKDSGTLPRRRIRCRKARDQPTSADVEGTRTRRPRTAEGRRTDLVPQAGLEPRPARINVAIFGSELETGCLDSQSFLSGTTRSRALSQAPSPPSESHDGTESNHQRENRELLHDRPPQCSQRRVIASVQCAVCPFRGREAEEFVDAQYHLRLRLAGRDSGRESSGSDIRQIRTSLSSIFKQVTKEVLLSLRWHRPHFRFLHRRLEELSGIRRAEWINVDRISTRWSE
jgi:hypothetical protein